MRKNTIEHLGLTVALVGGFAFGSACETKPNPKANIQPPAITRTFTPTPEPMGINIPERPVTLEQARQNVIKLQESKIDPASGEYALAVADYYCLRTPCEFTPDQLAEKVSFVDSNTFIEEFQNRSGRIFSPQERQQELERLLEFVGDDNKIYINKQKLTSMVEETKKKQPEIIRQLGKKDLLNVMASSIMVHSFTHVNIRDIEYSFDPFSIQLTADMRVPEIGKMRKFIFEAKQESGLPFYNSGADEAIVELASIIIGRSITYTTASNHYEMGAAIIAQLNRQAGISNDEFLSLVRLGNGQEPLLRRWAMVSSGQPNIKSTTMALFAIGLGVRGVFDKQKTIDTVNQVINPRVPIR